LTLLPLILEAAFYLALSFLLIAQAEEPKNQIAKKIAPARMRMRTFDNMAFEMAWTHRTTHAP
jgi:hypothetical protein